MNSLNALYHRINWTTKQPVDDETYSQSAQPRPSAEVTYPEVTEQTLIEDITRFGSPMVTSEGNYGPNNQYQEGGGFPASINGKAYSKVMAQHNVNVLSQAFNTLVQMQHELLHSQDVSNYKPCTQNTNIQADDNFQHDDLGRLVQQNADLTSEMRADLQNLVEQLGSSQLDRYVDPHQMHLETPSFQMQLRSGRVVSNQQSPCTSPPPNRPQSSQSVPPPIPAPLQVEEEDHEGLIVQLGDQNMSSPASSGEMGELRRSLLTSNEDHLRALHAVEELRQQALAQEQGKLEAEKAKRELEHQAQMECQRLLQQLQLKEAEAANLAAEQEAAVTQLQRERAEKAATQEKYAAELAAVHKQRKIQQEGAQKALKIRQENEEKALAEAEALRRENESLALEAQRQVQEAEKKGLREKEQVEKEAKRKIAAADQKVMALIEEQSLLVEDRQRGQEQLALKQEELAQQGSLLQQLAQKMQHLEGEVMHTRQTVAETYNATENKFNQIAAKREHELLHTQQVINEEANKTRSWINSQKTKTGSLSSSKAEQIQQDILQCQANQEDTNREINSVKGDVQEVRQDVKALQFQLQSEVMSVKHELGAKVAELGQQQSQQLAERDQKQSLQLAELSTTLLTALKENRTNSERGTPRSVDMRSQRGFFQPEPTLAQKDFLPERRSSPPGFPTQPQYEPKEGYLGYGYPPPPKMVQQEIKPQHITPLQCQVHTPRASHIGEGRKSHSMSGSSCGRTTKGGESSKFLAESLSKNIPTYNGTEPFGNFFELFEVIVDRCGYDDDGKFVCLAHSLRGGAQQWLKDQEGWSTWNYYQLVTALKAEYSNVITESVVALQNLQYKDDLKKFNSEFRKLGTGCKRVCSEYMQKQIYIKALKPHGLRTQLLGMVRKESLQDLMTTALELEGEFKDRSRFNNTQSGNNFDRNRPFGNRRRELCPKCQKWHPKDERCGSNNSNRPNRNFDPKDRKPKVNEGTLPEIPEEPATEQSDGEEVHEGAYEQHDMSSDEGSNL